jgi:hypothetical protein
MHAATHDELFDAREARGTVAALVPANGRSRSMARALASGRNVAFLRAERVLPHMSSQSLTALNRKHEPRFSDRRSRPELHARHRVSFPATCPPPRPRYSRRASSFVAARAAPPARRVVPVARAGAHVPKSPTRAAMALSATSSAVCAPAFASAGDRVADLALSDAWFGWYFAPGGVVLGPALIFTAFILGQALFEKLTGTGPKGKKKE